MRPDVLNPLFAEAEALKGVGPGIAKSLARLDLTRAIDLAYHLPTGAIERVRAPAASQGRNPAGTPASVSGALALRIRDRASLTCSP